MTRLLIILAMMSGTTVGLATDLPPSARPVDFSTLCQGFVHPAGPARARAQLAIPRGGWQIEALTEDLERMKNAGLGGAAYLDGYEGYAEAFGDISYFNEAEKNSGPFMSPEHLKKLNRFLEEAHKRDLQIVAPIRAMYMSGGPWIDQEHAAKCYTLSKMYVTGPGKMRIQLPEPAHRDADGVESSQRRKFYRDAAVVAWPVKADPRGTVMHRLKPAISVSDPESHAGRASLADGNPISAMLLHGAWLLSNGPRPAEPPKQTVITYEFPEPIEVDSCFIKLAPDKIQVPVRGSITSSKDGVTYRKAQNFEVRLGTETSIAMPREKARWFRVAFSPITSRDTIGVAEIEFLAPGEKPVTHERIPDFDFKTARACSDQSLGTKESDFFGSRILYEPDAEKVSGSVIPRASVRELTAQMNSAGLLEWDVPEGVWCVMRLGYTLAKYGYACARPGGAGYECDIYNADAARMQYENVPRRVLGALSAEARKGLQGFWFESFELGPVNWTTRMTGEFRRHAGYEMTSWLPVLADEIVEGPEQTDAFLADYRRTLHSLFAENHHGVLKELCGKDGLQWLSETGGSKQSHQDELLYLSQTHVPGGEFWGGQPVIGHSTTVTESSGAGGTQGDKPWWNSDAMVKLPASVSHTYGHSQFVPMEALIGSDFDFHRVPAFDKHVSDTAFCTGGNQFCVAIWPHDNRPGVFPGLHHWGWINPRNTVLRQSAAFFQYVSRCQSLLQQGLFQADVLIGQEETLHLRERNADQERPKVYVPKGYDFDFISRELLLQDLKVKDGALSLSSGTRYRVLQIPDFANRMSVETLRKIEQLLRDGAVVVAPKPVAGMTGLDYADGMAEHRALTDRVWSGLDGKKSTRKALGQGRLYWGASLEEVLNAEHIRPDFSYENLNGPAYVDHIHRTIEGPNIDIYFLANAVNQTAEIHARFRGQEGKIPHLFDPLSGEIRRVLNYKREGDDISVPLRLEPVGSVFVVFTEGADAMHIESAVDVKAPEKRVPPMEFLRSGEGNTVTAQVTANGTYRIRNSSGQSTELTVDTVPAPVDFNGSWKVDFRDMFGESFSREFKELKSFHVMEDEHVRYFSGEAAYHNRFELPKALTQNHRLYLDCGNVCWLAEIHVNGKNAGVVWCPPWRLDITPYCQAGGNTVEIICVNTWKNRLIGDAHLPENQRKTVLNNFRMKTSDFARMELMEAGLLGPVRIVAVLVKGVEF